jgi:hypothetical protein
MANDAAALDQLVHIGSDVEHGIECTAELLDHIVNLLQDLPAAAHDERLWWSAQKLQGSLDYVQKRVDRLNDMLRGLYGQQRLT